MRTLHHKFVDSIPEKLDDGIIYISLQYCTTIHKCVCGCGNEVVTPLSPNGWNITFNGKTVSLYPSIGNWDFKCESHYWIKENEVIKAGPRYKLNIDVDDKFTSQTKKKSRKKKKKWYDIIKLRIK